MGNFSVQVERTVGRSRYAEQAVATLSASILHESPDWNVDQGDFATTREDTEA